METRTINAKRRLISWGAIIGGVITVLALSVLHSVLGAGLGFTMVDPYSAQPAEGVGTAITVWSFVSILISLAVGGFVAGRLAGTAGISHGFLVWATSLIIAIIISSMVVGGAMRAAGNLIGSIASATGSTISGMASSLTDDDGIKDMLDDAMGQMGVDTGLTGDKTPQNVMAALQNSNVETLRPDYLARELAATKRDVQAAATAIMKQPDNMDAEMDRLSDKLKQRADEISVDIKRDDVHQALARNTNMTPEEINQATDGVIRGKQRMTMEVKQRLEELEHNVDSARSELRQMKEQAKQKADAAAKAIATSALWSFLALLVGLVVSALFGLWGVRTAYRFHF
ncbi:CAP-Gly protein [Acerihabitans arboris]|uniref:CAP-Gly protein n=1 Tax=Acerihabitans arboris TaxID=2691583 RepID=A0A845SNK2_9GAMM|nr:CAP-Gly protein [Acerihabitans arboris]NDL64962.1 CAP-Gly protein [Acerihabitans arboris]